jgi:hypothetical protein
LMVNVEKLERCVNSRLCVDPRLITPHVLHDEQQAFNVDPRAQTEIDPPFL